MDESTASTPQRGVEPTSNTIADLSALIAGVALAVSIEWYSGWVALQGFAGAPTPAWFVGLHYFLEATRKGLIAMIPVIIARKVQYGAAVRPAEFVALTVGASRLLLSFERIPALGLLILVPGSTINYTVDIDRYRIWMLIDLVVSMLCVAFAIVFRRRLQPWQCACLLVGVFLASGPMEFFINEARDPIADYLDLAYWGNRVANIVFHFPSQIVGMIPIVLAIRGFLQRRRYGTTWVEKACLTLGIIDVVGVQIRFYLATYLGSSTRVLWQYYREDLVKWGFATLIAWMLINRFGLRVSRWFGLDGTSQAR